MGGRNAPSDLSPLGRKGVFHAVDKDLLNGLEQWPTALANTRDVP